MPSLLPPFTIDQPASLAEASAALLAYGDAGRPYAGGTELLLVMKHGGLRYEHDKRLHVSPFFGLDQRYRYAFSEPGETLYARIEVLDGSGRPLQAVLVGERRELTHRTLGAALLRYPAMPMQVIGLIHWQALKLWLKRVPFHHKPPFVPGKGSVRA